MVVVLADSDDELSTSSTLAGNAVKEQLALQQSEQSLSQGASSPLYKGRTVRFNEESNEYHESTQSLMCKEVAQAEDDCDQGECKNAEQLLWYSRRECRDFRDANDNLARKIAHAEGGYLSMRNPFSYQNVMQRVYESCCFISSTSSTTPTTSNDDDSPNSSSTRATDDTLSVEERELKRWLTLDVNGETCDRWGLERMIVSSIAMDRFYRRHALMELVYHLQEEYEAAAAAASNNPNVAASNSKSMENTSIADTAGDDEHRGRFNECLRFHCEALTRPSCLFAMQLGQAAASATTTTSTCE
jgi:hypothetical protein